MASFRQRVGKAIKVLREGVSEPILGLIDNDDHLYRRLTGETRDLSPVTQERARTVARYLHRQNPLARRLVEMTADFVVGDGLTFNAVDEDVQEIINEFWNDPTMKMNLRHRDLVVDLAVNGELFLRAYDENGKVMLGYIDPDRVRGVIKDPENAFVDQSIELFSKRMAGGVEEIPIIQSRSTKAGLEFEGEVFAYFINRPVGATRGTPDSLALADWIDGYDQVMFNALDRASLMNSFIWDVTLKSADADQVSEWAKMHSYAPKAGTVRVHNDYETWQAVSPALGAAETETISRLIKNLILGGAGVPEGWFADGDSANRATLAAQGDPTYRMLTARQRLVGSVFEDIAQYVIAKAISAGRLSKGVDRTVTVILPDPSVEDTKGIAAALPQLMGALSAAKDAKFISEDSARKVFLSITGQLGIELEPDKELEMIEEEAEKAAKEAENQQPSLATIINQTQPQQPKKGVPAQPAQNDGSPDPKEAPEPQETPEPQGE